MQVYTATLSSQQFCLRSVSGAGQKIRQKSVYSQQQQQQMRIKELVAKDINTGNFAPFGQYCEPQEDGKVFDHEDAQLDLSEGTPRFYVMKIPNKGLEFSRITHHAKVTQCLGSLAPAQPWYLCVCKAGETPSEDNIEAFKIPHGAFIKLEKGTWHAGPYFQQGEEMNFYNLELKDTNIVDHNTVDFNEYGLNFKIVDNSEDE
eukprot:TRINITY_DN8419_c2_g1_i1.p1 TRINITY_DN8419_c2_g1~~TRINITY_DN8419_c2_g1_i1.p1  ORF type:complete len:203 (-),score=18.19 TRINITY_DN8419_c2_g1_i1:242-850(-)